MSNDYTNSTVMAGIFCMYGMLQLQYNRAQCVTSHVKPQSHIKCDVKYLGWSEPFVTTSPLEAAKFHRVD